MEGTFKGLQQITLEGGVMRLACWRRKHDIIENQT
jgi:hypothetical protein